MFLSRHEGEVENNQSAERRNRSQQEVMNETECHSYFEKQKKCVFKYSSQRKNKKYVLWVLK